MSSANTLQLGPGPLAERLRQQDALGLHGQLLDHAYTRGWNTWIAPSPIISGEYVVMYRPPSHPAHAARRVYAGLLSDCIYHARLILRAPRTR